MVLNDIEKLIEKYEEGETSLKEEQVLKAYFSQEIVAPHLEVYKSMFAYFSVNQQEQFTKSVPLPIKKVINYKWISVAAVVVLTLGIYFSSTADNELGTIQDPELAFNEVSKSLEMISKSLNKGVSTIGHLEAYQTGVSTLNYLNEIENTTSIIFKKNQ